MIERIPLVRIYYKIHVVKVSQNPLKEPADLHFHTLMRKSKVVANSKDANTSDIVVVPGGVEDDRSFNH